MSAAKQGLQVIDNAPSVALARTPMDMLNLAVEGGASIEVMERLMGLHERWEKNLARKAFDEAMAAAKAEIPVITRNATGHNSKKYADFAAIAKVIDPILGKHGLSYRFRTVQTDKISVTCVLFGHGHSEENTLAGQPDPSGSKNAIQAIGSTLTYLQRYSLVQALGLAAAADDDAKGIGAEPEKISADEAQNIRDMLTAKKANEAAFLKWAKVEKIEDIGSSNYDSCVDAIKALKGPGQ